MSPLLGSAGGSSEYSYRGTIDDWPNDFSFIDPPPVSPGGTYNSNTITISGINNRALVQVSPGASVSINSGPYVVPTELSPVFIKNNQTISVRISTTSGTVSDFNKTYSTLVTIGKKSTTWSIRTGTIDSDPVPFTFTNLTGREVGTAYTSNEIIIGGLEPGFSFPATVSNTGLMIINGGSPVSSANVSNGDRLYLRVISPLEYTDYPTGSGTKTTTTTVQVANYSTSWSVSTRNADLFIDPFRFVGVSTADLSSLYTRQATNNLGIVTTITGADPGLDLITLVSPNCELQVEQPTPGGVWSIRSGFSSSNTIVYNGDRLTVRMISPSEYSTTKIGIVTVSNQTAQFIITSRPRPVDTIPEPLINQFTDVLIQPRNTLIESNEITLVGMSTFNDQGTASIVSGTTGGGAQFKVTRGTTIVRDYASTNTPVQQGDKIRLRLTSSPDSNITRTATFRVDGIDTTNTAILPNFTSGFQDDIWSVTTAIRQCGITTFTLAESRDINPSTLVSTTFVATGFDADCQMIVSTSNPASYLSVPGSTLRNNIPVSTGTTVTVYMTSSSLYDTTVTTNVTLSNITNGVVPSSSYTTPWSVRTVIDTRPTSVTLSSTTTTVSLGQSLTLTWSSVNAVAVLETGPPGGGFTTSFLNGTQTVTPTVEGALRYYITVSGPPTQPNATATGNWDVTVTKDTTPDPISMNPSSLTAQARSTVVSSRAQAQNKTTVSVNNISPGITIPASCSPTTNVYMRVTRGGVLGAQVTSTQVQNDDIINLYMTTSPNYSTTTTASLDVNGTTASYTATTLACTVTDSSSTIASGVTVRYRPSIWTRFTGGTVSESLYVSNTITTSTLPKTGQTGGQRIWGGSEITGAGPYTFTIPEIGVTQAYVAVAGGGGGGGCAQTGNTAAGGGGGASAATPNLAVAPGSQIYGVVGDGGAGATSQGSGASGGTTTLRHKTPANDVLVLSAGGGGGGTTTTGGAGGVASGGTTNTNGQAGQPDGPGSANGGFGGSAGLLGNSTNPATYGPGAQCPSNNYGGGAGGGSTGIGMVPGGESPGPNAICTSQSGQPGNQASFGGGGGGGKGSGFGGNGRRGGARITYSYPTFTSLSWATLLSTIDTSFRNNVGRPPNQTELANMISWYQTAGRSDNWTTTDIGNKITADLNNGLILRASGFTDACGANY